MSETQIIAAENIYHPDDLNDFEDLRVRTLLYYVSQWYLQCDPINITMRCLMNNFYVWLAEQKPTLKNIAENSDQSSFAIYLLQSFSAADGDDMGGAELEDIKDSLIEYIRSAEIIIK